MFILAYVSSLFSSSVNSQLSTSWRSLPYIAFPKVTDLINWPPRLGCYAIVMDDIRRIYTWPS